MITATLTNETTGSEVGSYEKHPYFGVGSYGNRFNINSARHLYNIRYALENTSPAGTVSGGVYTQGKDIDLMRLGSEVTVFIPINDFSGTYNGNGCAIINLIVDTAGNAGLFTSITSGAEARDLKFKQPFIISSDGNAGVVCAVNNGAINVLTIENPRVQGGTNAGAVCGANRGTVNDAYIGYSGDNRRANFRIEGIVSAGGIAGLNDTTGLISTPHSYRRTRSPI